MIAQYETNLACRKRDENGDMVFGNGASDYLTGIEAMAEVIKSRIQAVQDEWWEGDDTALPYFDEILTAYRTEENRGIIDLMIVQRLMDTRGVLAIQDTHSEYKGRNYFFSCTAVTVYGQTPVEVTI